jgi:RNA polymerase sigma-70 factor (ECF subfamily)
VTLDQQVGKTALNQQIQSLNEIQSNMAWAADLIRNVSCGDRSSLIALYERTNPLIFGLICRIVGDQASAEEVLLDAYTEIWKQSSSYNPEHFLPLQWMIHIARSRAIARLHWGKAERRRRELSGGTEESLMTVAPEQQKLACVSIGALAPAQREVLDWAYYSGLSCREIAAQLGQPLGAVKNHVRTGMNRIIELLYPPVHTKA